MGKSKETDPDQSGQNHNGALDDFPLELRDQAAAAMEAEHQSVERAHRRLEASRRERAHRLGAPPRAGPRLQAGRALEGLRRDAQGRRSRRPSSPRRPDKIPVLFEMVEVYRDRLKLDVMVVNAFNQILTIQPDNLEAVDALAASTRR